ncbi:DUF1365 domain-containing protein [Enterovirga rhinocerotis]|uniref:DUF1365 family protein n=1 Tax=Enterovirga rhinocerotis TaxID=1339210 RepID=A0A4R7CA82_9HYPH|nr:DUF1365 domain-containing protein [Enterovirga rhinocerotis]TDR94275.1 hypothetical protein EV668_1558 [Enterovirga rhinocerotis]
MSGHSALYVGRVKHHRFRPRPHSLAYRVYWTLLDLDEIDELASGLRFFSRSRFNLYSFRDADYGDRTGRPLKPQIEAILADSGIDCEGGPIRLLTMPRVLGYAFNPISTYFCHRPDGSLHATVYEVHNTFGEIHTYVAPAAPDAAVQRQTVGKAFHVSPFMGLAMNYRFSVVPPGERVSMSIEGHDDEGRLIVASLNGQRAPLSDSALLRLLVSHPLVTLKVTAAIHWHALRLLAKRIPFWPHPAPPKRSVSLGATVAAAAEGARRS